MSEPRRLASNRILAASVATWAGACPRKISHSTGSTALDLCLPCYHYIIEMAPTRSSARASSSSSPSQAPRPQPSRKGKAAWRRNIDLADVDEHLESQRVAERLGTGPSSSSSAPFELDTKGDEALGNQLRQKRQKRPLKSLQVLQNDSAVPAFTGRRKESSSSSSSSASRKGTGKMSKLEKERLTRLAKRDVKGAFGVVVEQDDANGRRALSSIKGTVMRTPEEDAWQQAVDEAKAAVAAGKRPTLPSVSAPSTAQSYNPTAKSHEELLQRAYAAELKRFEEEQANREYKERWNAGAGGSDDAESKNRFAGMLIDEAERGGEEEEEGDEVDDEEAAESRAPQRKTRTQRIRAQRRIEAERAETAKRVAKAQRAIVSQLPSMAKRLRREEAARLAAREARTAAEEERLAAEGLAGKRVGKHLVPTSLAERDALRVHLDEELTESLRALKAEGADAGGAFRERWDRMVLRGLVEPRVPKGSSSNKGNRRKKREYETHSYKRFS